MCLNLFRLNILYCKITKKRIKHNLIKRRITSHIKCYKNNRWYHIVAFAFKRKIKIRKQH